jgi:rubrerythrin
VDEEANPMKKIRKQKCKDCGFTCKENELDKCPLCGGDDWKTVSIKGKEKADDKC